MAQHDLALTLLQHRAMDDGDWCRKPTGHHHCGRKRRTQPKAQSQIQSGWIQGVGDLAIGENEHRVRQQDSQTHRGTSFANHFHHGEREPRQLARNHTQPSAAHRRKEDRQRKHTKGTRWQVRNIRRRCNESGATRQWRLAHGCERTLSRR